MTASLGPDDLVLSWFSLLDVPFEERVAAASAAGFTGMGMYLGAYRDLKAQGWTARQVGALFDDHGLVLAELEALRIWPTEAEAERQAGLEDLAYELADTLGVRYLQGIGSPGVEPTADGFAALCDRAAAHGLTVGIEYLPYTAVTDARTAGAVVDAAGRTNGGVCVDSWHHERGARDLDQIAALPGDRIVAIQLNDGTIAQADPDLDYRSDCLLNRRAPGDGEFDLGSLIRVLDASGTTAPISIEAPSSTQAEIRAAAWCRRLADGMRAVLAVARSEN